MGDIVLYEIDESGERRMLHGTPIEERDPDATYEPASGFRSAYGTVSGAGVLLTTTLYDDTGSLAFLDLSTGRANSSRWRSPAWLTKASVSWRASTSS